MPLLQTIVEQARAQTAPEIIAVVAAVLYLVLAIRENILCWLFAAISTSIYIWLFIDAKLYMESVLNVFYLVMAVYGWRVWSEGGHEEKKKPVVVWPWRRHAVAIAVIIALSAMNGYALSTYSDAAYPYIDSLTTWFAIWATFLVARKVLENWWYWLVIDAASVFIYWSRDLQLTSVLFAVYVLMIPFGLIAWSKSMHKDKVPVTVTREIR